MGQPRYQDHRDHGQRKSDPVGNVGPGVGEIDEAGNRASTGSAGRSGGDERLERRSGRDRGHELGNQDSKLVRQPRLRSSGRNGTRYDYDQDDLGGHGSFDFAGWPCYDDSVDPIAAEHRRPSDQGIGQRLGEIRKSFREERSDQWSVKSVGRSAVT